MRTNAVLTIPVPRTLSDAFGPYAAFVVALAMLFGGGTRQGLWSDVLVELPALLLLPWAISRLAARQLGRLGRWALVLFCAIVVLPLLQLVPLPPALWSALAGRGQFAAAYQAVGMPIPWMPITLAPNETWRGFLSLLPSATIFLTMLSLDAKARRVLVIIVLAFALISVPLDLLQMLDGLDSALRFYAITNLDRAVGFFANANHQAAFLYCAIPLAAAFALKTPDGRGQSRRYDSLILTLSLAGIVVAISLTLSRAGAILGFVSGLLSLALALRHHRGRSGRRLLIYAAGAIAAALLIGFQFGFVDMLQRTADIGLMGDLRWPVAEVTWRAARNFLPLGSGFGTFVPVYEIFAPPTLLHREYVNHAHDDWLELWLTGGVPALVLLAGFLLWFFSAAIPAWLRDHSSIGVRDIALARAGSIVVLLLLAHSIVDYPLRTIDLSVLLAICCGLLIPSIRADRGTESVTG